jgi:hypothetical protein
MLGLLHLLKMYNGKRIYIAEVHYGCDILPLGFDSRPGHSLRQGRVEKTEVSGGGVVWRDSSIRLYPTPVWCRSSSPMRYIPESS